MNSEIQRNEKWVRPSFHHHTNDFHCVPPEAMAAQIIESLRNLSEANFERLMALQLRQLEVLKRIDRRLATKIKIRGHK